VRIVVFGATGRYRAGTGLTDFLLREATTPAYAHQFPRVAA
jgi:hypothetical protein